MAGEFDCTFCAMAATSAYSSAIRFTRARRGPAAADREREFVLAFAHRLRGFRPTASSPRSTEILAPGSPPLLYSEQR